MQHDLCIFYSTVLLAKVSFLFLYCSLGVNHSGAKIQSMGVLNMVCQIQGFPNLFFYVSNWQVTLKEAWSLIWKVIRLNLLLLTNIPICFSTTGSVR